MSGGLIALLDDVALLAKQAAASLDDIAAGAARSASGTIPVLIDDAAVTPQYVNSISPKRELPVIWKITLGSLKNKFFLVVPLALILSWLAPWALPYLLILGGLYLSFEGGHKVLEWLKLVDHHETESGSDEREIVRAATRTDLVLSTEIMLISLAGIETDNWIMRALMLCLIAIGMTIAVYGTVALLVKVDDIGLHLAARAKTSFGQKFGLSMAKSMPAVFNLLSIVGTAAMLWVGGHLIWKSVGDAGLEFASHTIHSFEALGNPVVIWTVETLCSAILGLIIGVISYYTIQIFSKSSNKTLH
jgi:predicted DNA repair protein MutK